RSPGRNRSCERGTRNAELGITGESGRMTWYSSVSSAFRASRSEFLMPFTAAHLYFEDLEVGRDWESMGRTVTEADIVNFAGLSGDFNPIHVDHSFAAETPFRKPIAHGMLVFSIASGLGVHSPPVRTLAFLGVKEWHFRGPVFPGDTVRI